MEEIKNELDDILEELNENIIDKSSVDAYFGILTFTRKGLEKLKATNKKVKINMAGMLTFSKDVTSELVKETIESVKVRGIVKAPIEVKEVLKKLK